MLVPVLGRPENAQPLVASLRASTHRAHEIVFIATAGDHEQFDACVATRCRTIIATWEPEHDYPRKMNEAFRLTNSDWVLLGSDDITFERGWDDALERAAASGKRVLGTDDRANRLVKRGVFSTHTLVARSYVEEHGGCLEGPGFLVSEAYDHNFVDRELACLAKARDEWLFVPQAVIRHRHPAFGSARQDATYEKGRDTFWEDQLLFWTRAEQWGNVGLLPQEISVKKRSAKRMERLAATARARRAAP